jgi:protein-tyrosine phosphatase
MGNKSSEAQIKQDRERALLGRSVHAEIRRYEKLKPFLPYLQGVRVTDDISDTAVQARMSHFFENSALTSASPIKAAVSKKKFRFTNDLFNLDLAYITDRSIALGYPSVGFESVYRNSRDDVVAFLTSYHPTHFKLYNLCRELNRFYNNDFTSASVAYFPFKDHNPPEIFLMLEFCVDAYLYLAQHPENIIAVHCKAGKGRTGVMLCAYLLFLQVFETAEEALDLYGRRRASDGKGVTIPSQRRYLKYFELFLKREFLRSFTSKVAALVKNPLLVKTHRASIHRRLTLLALNIGPLPEARLSQARVSIEKFEDEVTFKHDLNPSMINNCLHFEFPANVREENDLNIKIKHKNFIIEFWVHLFFIERNPTLSRDLPAELVADCFAVELTVPELDKIKPKSLKGLTVILVANQKVASPAKA